MAGGSKEWQMVGGFRGGQVGVGSWVVKLVGGFFAAANANEQRVAGSLEEQKGEEEEEEEE